MAYHNFDGYEPLCDRNDEDAAVAQDAVRWYCDRVDLSYRTYDRYLDVEYLYRLGLD